MLKYIGDFDKDLTKYGFVRANDYEIAYIKRMDNVNAFIDLGRCCVSFRNNAFDDLIKDGLVIKEAE